jgi:NADH dehydrogenase [ubiquinone] 1 alpha subcomplex assembly factor 7
VDFSTLRRYATQQPGVHAYGPIGQGAFLQNMGIQQRLEMLVENCETDEQASELVTAAERLVQADQMGTIFKAMAITNTAIGRPVGFELAAETVNGVHTEA